MVEKSKLTEILGEILSGEMFLVDITISKANLICIYIDSFNGLSIDDCIRVSRYVESKLDRNTEDFELEVSSPGIGQPIKVKQQYTRNIGRDLEIVTTEGTVLRGRLEKADLNGINLGIRVKEKTAEGKKEEALKSLFLGYETINTAKVIISFK